MLIQEERAAQRLSITELWVGFVCEKIFRHVEALEIARGLGADQYTALPMFHPFSECDTFIIICGRGKKTALETWKAFNNVTRAFCTLATTADAVEYWMEPLQQFLVLLYDCASSHELVNQARKEPFVKKG